MRINRDLIWKSVFRKYLKEFFGFFFPRSYHKIDWSKGVTFLDKELHKLYLKSKQKNRVADVLVCLYLKNGNPVWMLLHVEIQGYKDDNFDLRFHQMQYRIEETFGEIPAMLAIYTDDDPNFHPKKYQKTVLGSKTLTVFNTYKVMDNPPFTYKKPNSAVAIIMEVAYYATQTKGLKDADIMNLHFPIVRKLFNAGFPKDEIEFLMSFIQKYVKFGNQKNHRIFEQKIEGMAKFDYDTTEDLLAVLDTSLQLKRLEQKANLLEQEKERERGEKERERQLKERSVLLLLQKGTDMELIAEVLRVPVKEILDIQEKYKDWDLFDDAPNSTN